MNPAERMNHRSHCHAGGEIRPGPDRDAAAAPVQEQEQEQEQLGPPGPAGWSRDTDLHPKSHRWTLHRRGSAHDRDGLNVGVQSCK